jgi:DNA-binding NtrC family response regulator
VSRGAVKQAERARILQALQHANGNRAKTAKLLKISRASLYNKLRGYNIHEDRGIQEKGTFSVLV